MGVQIGDWVLFDRAGRLVLAQVSHVGFIAEVAIAREWADGSESLEFFSASPSRLIVVDPGDLAWEGDRPQLPQAEVDRRKQAADAAAEKKARDLERARAAGARFEVTMGGSGRWVARLIVEDYQNGRHRVTEPSFTGHVPVRKMGESAARMVVERQLRRKVAAGETAQPSDGPRGGRRFVIQL